MEKPNFEIEHTDNVLTDFEKRVLYEDLSEICMDYFGDNIWEHKGNFVAHKRIGSENENNIEMAALLKYYPNKDSHELIDLSFSVNEVSACTDETFDQMIKSSIVSFYNGTMEYTIEYYLNENNSQTLIRVCLDDFPDSYNRKVGRKLTKLNKDYEKSKHVLTEYKLEELMLVIEKILMAAEDLKNTNWSEDDENYDDWDEYDG